MLLLLGVMVVVVVVVALNVLVVTAVALAFITYTIIVTDLVLSDGKNLESFKLSSWGEERVNFSQT